MYLLAIFTFQSNKGLAEKHIDSLFHNVFRAVVFEMVLSAMAGDVSLFDNQHNAKMQKQLDTHLSMMDDISIGGGRFDEVVLQQILKETLRKKSASGIQMNQSPHLLRWRESPGSVDKHTYGGYLL